MKAGGLSVIKAGVHRKLGSSSPKLPAPLTSFIGRKLEMEEVKRALAATRLLTLTGVGGCGKTRLALRVTSDLAEAHTFKEGTYCWVDLAALSDESLVPKAIARALGLREVPEPRIMEVLSNSLREKTFLLVLDNCEHLVTPCAKIVKTLLLASPHLQILATSREPLQVEGETTWLVPSLSMPDPKQLPRQSKTSLAVLKQSDAIALFVARAASILPTFALSRENANAILQVCRRLDGIPLALELAATRVNVLTVEQIAERLNDRFALLDSGNRTALLPRHHTLRATLDWSYDLLSEKERQLFLRLAVFAGGFTLDAAEAVGSGDRVEPREILGLLSRLVDKSLIDAQTQARREARFFLLETIRQYASEKLVASDQSILAQKKHAAFFRALAEQTERKLHGPDQVIWLDRLEIEHDNFRAALTWSLTKDRETAVRLASALAWFWGRRDHFSEGRRWLDAVLAAGGGAPASLRIKALTGAGLLANAQGDDAQGRILLDQSLALARNEDDKLGIAWSLQGLARVAAYQSEQEHAAAFLKESLVHFRDLGDLDGAAYSIQILGVSARLQGNYPVAHEYLQESLSISRQVGDKWLIAWVLINLARVAFVQRHADVLNLLQESLVLCRELKTARGVDACLQLLAQVAGAQKRLPEATRLLSAVAYLDQIYGFRAPLPSDRVDIDHIMTMARAELGADVFAAIWAEGRALSLDQAVEQGLELASSLQGNRKSIVRQSPNEKKSYLLEPLNERELQVLRLIANGFSNHEIADQLTIALGTVKWHINNLFRKLDVHSRTRAIVRAKELNLV